MLTFHIFLYRFPFEWRNPIGFIVAAILEALPIYYAPLLVLSDLFFVFGACKLLSTMADDVCTELRHRNTTKKLKKPFAKPLKCNQISNGWAQIEFQLNANANSIEKKYFWNWIASSISDLFVISMMYSDLIVRCISCGWCWLFLISFWWFFFK